MPLNETQRSQAFKKALSYIRNSGATVDTRAISAAICRTLDCADAAERGQVSGIIRGALKAYNSGTTLNVRNQGPLTIREHGTDASLAGNVERFGYRVIVSYVDPVSGDKFETAITIPSATTLSYAQIEARARAEAAQQRFERDYRTQVGGFGANPRVDVFVISAGVRP